MGLFKSIKKAFKNPSHSGLVKGLTAVGDGTAGSLTHYADKARRKYGLTRSSLLQSAAPVSSASGANQVFTGRSTLSQMTGGR